LARRFITDFAELAAERLLFRDRQPELAAMQQPDNPPDDKSGIPADLDKLKAELEQLARPQNDSQNSASPAQSDTGARELTS
jgi:hypothetical protein